MAAYSGVDDGRRFNGGALDRRRRGVAGRRSVGREQQGATDAAEARGGARGDWTACDGCCGGGRRRRRRQLRRGIAGGTGDENPRGKAEEQEGEEENPVEAFFALHARWKKPPIQEDFGRPEEGGDGGGRRLLVWGRFGGVAGGPRKMTE